MTLGEGAKEQTYSTPGELLAKAYSYFTWCESNPCRRTEIVKSGDRKGDVVDVPLGRPFTIVGLCVFCGISENTFKNYATNASFKPVIEHLQDIVKQEQTEGASVGLYSSGIMSRLLSEQENQIHEPHLCTISINTIDDKTKKEVEKLRQHLQDK